MESDLILHKFVKNVGASILVGTVITWPSNSWPSGRDNGMECNGKTISRAIYPELVIVIPVGYLFRESTIVNWRT